MGGQHRGLLSIFGLGVRGGFMSVGGGSVHVTLKYHRLFYTNQLKSYSVEV